jgi:excisionase family DNA binding protein
MLSIGRTKFYQLVASGELRHARIGRAIRVSTADIEAFLEFNSQGGAQ